MIGKFDFHCDFKEYLYVYVFLNDFILFLK